MRLVLAIISFFLAAVMIGFGIAQRTVLVGDDHVTAAVTTTGEATVTVIDGATLNAFDRSQTLNISGADTIFAAYGRTNDVLAWVGDASHNVLSYDAESGKLVSELVAGTETEVPDPTGSDLWLADYTQAKQLGFTVNVPEDISVLIVSDGIEPAPAKVSVTWLLDNSTPFAGPLVVGGAILLLLGLGFLLWAVTHVRRSRGPRRKQPKLPKVPRKPTYKPVKKGAPQPAAITRGRRASGMIAVPVILAGVLAISGCTADPVATLENGDAVEVASTADPATTNLEAPAVTLPQAKRIVSRIAATVAEADAATDPAIVATRMDGPALETRLANYAIRKVQADAVAVPALPSTLPSSAIVLPQQRDGWPRTVFVVIPDETDETVAPVAMMLIQDDARSQYKVHYTISLLPGAVIPKVAPANVGAVRLLDDVKLLTITPSEIGADYADILTNDVDSPSYALFDTETDPLRIATGRDARVTKAGLIPPTAQLTFLTAIGDGQIITLATNDGGAIVALNLDDTETIKPIETGAAANAPPDVAALIGKTSSPKGIAATYTDQLLFYVPAATVGGKIILLGYTQGLASAVELP